MYIYVRRRSSRADHTEPYRSYRASQQPARQHTVGICTHDWLHSVFQLLNCHGLYPFEDYINSMFHLNHIHLYLKKEKRSRRLQYENLEQ